ncbi:ABC transporter substrate-binding protein [Clostridium lacusfryxellense]|uniref:ABC transporter substrate-binding protein n=1 Tax=Clostridium lacusfryxellense TaxID=205328 RepID=UPI001C0CBB9A|nr:sugar ABC transporter substrate-binding protein [Clostridium lacusfryxellense]MBU3113302.1 sugar ABC transporter substrate-binding protein [Clostridium lacusfryxellense]
MSKSLKKFLAIATCTTLIVSALIGCGSSGTTSSTNAKNTKKGPVTITYAIWDKNQEPGMKAIADAFHVKNPSITVKVEVTPWDQYWTKLEAAATGGALPDVFWMHINNFLKYQSNGMIMDITDKLKSSKDVDLNNFPKGLVELYKADGKNYGIPKDYDTIGLWYNKTMFDNAKIPYPDATWDWNKLVEVSKKLTDKSKGVYGFLAPYSDQEGFWNAIYQNKGYVTSPDKTKSGYDQAATKEAVQWWVDLSNKHKVSPTVQQFADTSTAQYLESGKVAMAYFGSWMVSEFKGNDYVKANCDVAVMPHQKGKATIYNGLGNVVGAKSKNAEESWKFLEFMGTKEANELQASNGSAIPAYKGTEKGWAEFSPEFNLKVYPEMLDYGVIYMNSKTAPKWQESQKTLITKILANQITVEEGCTTIAKEMNEFLATEK